MSRISKTRPPFAIERGGSLFQHIGLIILCGVAAHGSILLTDYILWDGWSYGSWLSQHDQLSHMRRLFQEIGRPLDMLFWLPFVGAENTAILAKWAGVGAWLVSPCLMYLVLEKAKLVTREVALFCCVLAAVLPVFDVLGELSIWMNTASVVLFWGAWLLVLSLPRRAPLSWFVRAVALAFFWLAFNLNSQLVFYCAFAVSLAALPKNRDGLPAVFDSLRRSFLRYPDFALLPFFYWGWKWIFTPNSGYYLDYNRPTLSAGVLGQTSRSLWEGFVLSECYSLFDSGFWVVLSVLVVALAGFLLSRCPRWWPSLGGIGSNAGLLLVGLFLLLAAALPYAVVDQSFQSFGWLSRNCILFPLPLAMMITGAIGLSSAGLAPTRPAVPWLLLVFVVLLAIGSANRTTLRWQAFGAKQVSIAEKLQASFAQDPPAVVQLRDYFPLPQTIYFYPPIVWTHILSYGAGTPRSFVVQTTQMAPDQIVTGADGRQERRVTVVGLDEASLVAALEQTTMPYALTGIPRVGSQAVAIVEPGELGVDAVGLGWEYLKRRLFDRAAIPAFLDQLTSVQVRELPAIQSTSSSGMLPSY